MPGWAHNVEESLLVSCVPLTVNICFGIPYEVRRSLKTMYATLVKVFCRVGIPFVSLEYPSVVMKTY